MAGSKARNELTRRPVGVKSRTLVLARIGIAAKYGSSGPAGGAPPTAQLKVSTGRRVVVPQLLLSTQRRVWDPLEHAVQSVHDHDSTQTEAGVVAEVQLCVVTGMPLSVPHDGLAMSVQMRVCALLRQVDQSVQDQIGVQATALVVSVATFDKAEGLFASS